MAANDLNGYHKLSGKNMQDEQWDWQEKEVWPYFYDIFLLYSFWRKLLFT